MGARQIGHKAGRLALGLGLTVVAVRVLALGAVIGDWSHVNGTMRYAGGRPYIAPSGSFETLPYGARAYAYGGRPYYWYGGSWYMPAYYGGSMYYYPVIEPTPGLVGSVPEPYQIVHVGGGVYYVSNGVYYQPINSGGLIWYRVVAAHGQ